LTRHAASSEISAFAFVSPIDRLAQCAFLKPPARASDGQNPAAQQYQIHQCSSAAPVTANGNKWRRPLTY
jgi:hypothetical protein